MRCSRDSKTKRYKTIKAHKKIAVRANNSLQQKGENLTERELQAMADYLTSSTHTELRGELNRYLTAPAGKKRELLAELWDKYGDRITARMK